MAWSSAPLVGSMIGTGGSGGSITLAEPVGAQAGDLLYAYISHKDQVAFDPPAGWTELPEYIASSSSKPSLSRFFIKRGASTPDLTFTRTGGSNATGRILAYRPSTGDFTYVGDTTGDLVEYSSTSGTSHATSGGVITENAHDLVIAAAAAAAAYHIYNFAATDPSGSSGTTVDTSTAPADGQWYLRADDIRSVSSTHALSVADGLRASAGATGALTATTSNNTTVVLGMSVFTEGSVGGGSDTITADEQPARVYEGASGSATITVTGSHTGATDTIEVQIEDEGSNVIVGWQTLEASVAEGTFSGTVSVPKGGMYIAKVRKASDTLVTDAQSTMWGVGYIIGGFGQSHMANLLTLGTGTADSRAFVHDGSSWSAITTTGEGRNALAALLISYADAPVALIMTGVGGTALSYWWSSGKTTAYDTWEAKVTAAGQGLSGFVWWQGDADAVAATAKATYKAGMDAMFAQLRTDYGASLPIVITVLGGKSGGTDANWENIRDAHIDAGNDTNNLVAVSLDAEHQGDLQHFTAAGSAVIGQRIARALADGLGDVATSRGPIVSSALLVNLTTIDVSLTHDGGTDFTPTTGITGFRVLDDGTPVTISGAAQQDPSTVRITLSSAITGTATVQYGYGAYPDMSGALLDNNALAIPLQSTDADVLVSVPRTGSISASEVGSDISAVQGVVPISGIVSIVEQNQDSVVVTGQVSVLGSLLTAEQTQDSSVFLGLVSVSGVVSSTEPGFDSAGFSGYLTASSAIGALNLIEQGSDVSSLVGSVLINGSLSSTELGSDLASILGDASSAVIGQVVAVESGSDISALVGHVAVSGAVNTSDQGSDISDVNGQVLIVGAMSTQESALDSAAIFGTSSNNTSGAISAQEQINDSASFVGSVLITGAMITTDSSDTTLIRGLVVVSGSMSIQESNSDTALIISNLPLTIEVSPFYQRMIDTAYKLIADKGRSITINRMGATVRNVITGTFSESVSISWSDAKAVILPASKDTIQAFDNQLEMSTLVGKKLRFALVAADEAPFQPHSLDEVFIDDEKWIVLGCTPLSPTGADIIYKMGLVKA